MHYCPTCQASINNTAVYDCPACGREGPERGWPVDDLIGGSVLMRYRLERRIGAGGMGVVYRALDAHGVPYAVKILHAWLSQSDDMVRRFRREARAASRLQGPHAVKVVEFGELASGSLALVMEFVDAESLSKRLLHTGWLSTEEGLDLLAQLADGLSEAHNAGLVHRDLKPDNILLQSPPPEAPQGTPALARILDFGIVKYLDASLGTIGQTVEGRVFGTPEYMSPEQARGDVHLDQRSDIFSLGVCAFLWWTGRLPFDGPNAQAVMMARLSQDAPLLSGARPGRRFPPALDALVARMLVRDPAVRLQTMEAVAIEARALLSPEASARRKGANGAVPVQAGRVEPTIPRSMPRSPSARTGAAGQWPAVRYALMMVGFLAAMCAAAWLLRPT